MYLSDSNQGDWCVMRIVAGKYGSRPLKSPKTDATRPTSDKIKGAIFSSLGNDLEGKRMLDCYSGTGNMALEALSRGCAYATMVDNNRQAITVIKENVKSLKETNCEVIQGNIFSVLKRLKKPYDLIYIDPPYAKEENVKLIETLDVQGLIAIDAVVIVESLEKQTFPDQVSTLIKYKEKTYGITKITYYRKERDI